MDSSDSEVGSEVDDILRPEDLFNDEPDEERPTANDEEAEEKPDKPGDEESKAKGEKKPKPKKVVKNPRVLLNYESLIKPSGLPALKKLFADFKFKGNGHEMEDLTKIMGILQQWMCYQLCPSYDFESCMLQLEALGKKKVVQTLMKKFRLGIDDWGESKSDNENKYDGDDGMETSEPTGGNEIDVLLGQEFADIDSECELSLIGDEVGAQQSTQIEAEVTLTPEQLERIARNKKLAEEKRMKRMSQKGQLTADIESAPVNDSEVEAMAVDDNT